MRIAIIGCGSIGARHARNAKTLGCDVIPVDLNHNRAASLTYELGELGWSEELCAFDDVDAVIICTPARTHVDIAEQLLRDGYRGPLFVEKPIAHSSDAAGVFRTWPHPVTMVGYNWRFHPELQPLAGLLGLGGTLHLDVKTDIRTWPGQGYGDPLLECSHEIDLACHWLGDPWSVHGGSLDLGAGAWLQLQHRPKLNSIIDLRWHRDPAPRSYTLHLESGSAVHARIGTGADAPGLAASYTGELSHFLDAVRAHQEQRPYDFQGCTFAEGLRVVAICECIKELSA